MGQRQGTTSGTLDNLVDRYVAVWNEPDTERRHAEIAALWGEDGGYLTQSIAARGHDAIVTHIADVYEEFVRMGGFVFRATHDADGYHDVVRVRWEMVPAVGGASAGGGFDILVLDGDGRIRCDYQFLDSPPSP